MIASAAVVGISLLVQDAGGHVNTHAIHADGASAVVTVCNKTKFPGRCGVLLTTIGFRESGLNEKAVHDGGRGCGAWGVLCKYKHATWLEQAESAWALIVYSATLCEEALALYASGSCKNAAGIEISRARIKEAKRVEALAIEKGLLSPKGDL